MIGEYLLLYLIAMLMYSSTLVTIEPHAGTWNFFRDGLFANQLCCFEQYLT